jgi:hypothetical protein
MAEISTNWGRRARSTTPKSVLVGRWSPKYSRCGRAVSSMRKRSHTNATEASVCTQLNKVLTRCRIKLIM